MSEPLIFFVLYVLPVTVVAVVALDFYCHCKPTGKHGEIYYGSFVLCYVLFCSFGCWLWECFKEYPENLANGEPHLGMMFPIAAEPLAK